MSIEPVRMTSCTCSFCRFCPALSPVPPPVEASGGVWSTRHRVRPTLASNNRMCPSPSLSKACLLILSLPHQPVRSLLVGLNAIAPPHSHGIPFFHKSSMSTASEMGASPRWEGHWSAGLNKGDIWDAGVVSPALQELLDEGVKGRTFLGL